ncbi:hypothetical protein GCM10009738_76920 [Kitasatospora viridis]|uniref:Thiopeptide-type bacteriocin biosynthesis protein n=1 Tax=Kitasatospora viridis TaxID=281105 RepID=A0A561UGW5_9ACTN|nr:thiopeptide-type bacteriocin biosynthesis protein [Kitasatospora viridis]
MLEAAEEVFTADSRAVAAALRHLPAAQVHPTALVAVGMLHITQGFFGQEAGAAWLAEHPSRPAPVERATASQATALASLTGWPSELAEAKHDRAQALGAYQLLLPEDADRTSVVESLLHMHHNRLVGLDLDAEAAARRLARQLARAQQEGQRR